MNKRFASFLLTGKVATLPLFAQESLGALQAGSSKDSTLNKIHESLDARPSASIRPLAHEWDNNLLLRHAFIESHMPQIMNLVINGLHDKDEVLIVVSPEKDTAKLLESNPDVLSIPHSVILSHFTAINSGYSSKTVSGKKFKANVSSSGRTIKPFSLPVNLDPIRYISNDRGPAFLHVLVAPLSKWDKSLIRYSDVFELKSIDTSMLLSQYTEDCTVYTCP